MKHSLRGALAAFAAVAAAVLVAAGCGGGVGTGGTGSFALSAGPIGGFGSVIVNGVRFDDTTARVEDADGTVIARDDLRLGMSVEVESDGIVAAFGGATATASRIRVVPEIDGVVADVFPLLRRITVLGQTVQLDAATAVDPSLQLGIAGRRVEIHAAWDADAGLYRATRIGLSRKAPGDDFVLRGVVTALGGGGATVGSALVGGTLPAGSGVGSFVRLRIQSAAANSAQWTLRGGSVSAPPAPDGGEARLRGRVSAIASATSFSVNGLPVDASGAQVSGGPVNRRGLQLEIEGRYRGGTLVATKVEVKAEGGGGERFRLEGAVQSLNAGAQTFAVRGQTVFYGAAQFTKGSAADLGRTPAPKVKVSGVLSADGTRVEATTIEVDD